MASSSATLHIPASGFHPPSRTSSPAPSAECADEWRDGHGPKCAKPGTVAPDPSSAACSTRADRRDVADDSSSADSDFESYSGGSELSDVSSVVSSEIPEVILEASDDEPMAEPLQPIATSPQARAASTPQTVHITRVAWTPRDAWTTEDVQGEVAPVTPEPSPVTSPVTRARLRDTAMLPSEASEPQTIHDALRPEGPSVAGLGCTLPRSAARRALQAERALVAERASREADLVQQAMDAADKEAIIRALNDDRAALAAFCERREAEIKRLKGELWTMRADLWMSRADVLEAREAEASMRRTLERQQRAQGICVVCLDALAAIAAIPCGHLALCEECAQQFSGDTFPCPVCRQPTESLLRIYTA